MKAVLISDFWLPNLSSLKEQSTCSISSYSSEIGHPNFAFVLSMLHAAKKPNVGKFRCTHYAHALALQCIDLVQCRRRCVL